MSEQPRDIVEAYIDRVTETMRRDGRSDDAIAVVLDALRERLDPDDVGALSLDEARALVASLEPPSSYARAAPAPTSPTAPPAPRLGYFSVAALAATVLAFPVLGLFGILTGVDLGEIGGSVLIIGFTLAIIAGVMARHSPLGRFGLYGGLGLLALSFVLSMV